MRGYSFRVWLGLALLLGGFAARWHLGSAIGLFLLIADKILPLLIRCPVCGLHVWTCTGARALTTSQREDWLSGLDSCPVCGDDGRATDQSRASWENSGRLPEAPYWSAGRLALAILATVVLVGGGIAIGVLYRIRP